MYLKLPTTYVDPDTMSPLPDAILVIGDAEFKLRSGESILQLAVYANAAAFQAGRGSVSEHATALSPAEITLQQPALMQACLTILLTRPEYAGATLITP